MDGQRTDDDDRTDRQRSDDDDRWTWTDGQRMNDDPPQSHFFKWFLNDLNLENRSSARQNPSNMEHDDVDVMLADACLHWQKLSPGPLHIEHMSSSRGMSIPIVPESMSGGSSAWHGSESTGDRCSSSISNGTTVGVLNAEGPKRTFFQNLTKVTWS